MNSPRLGIRLVSCLIMFLWGAVLLYFYASGRISYYLPPDAIFRPMVLWSGIAMCGVGLFNLLTVNVPDGGCDHHHDHHHDHDCHHHEHGHVCEHHKPHAHTHAHGALESSGALGRFVALVILTVPLGVAALLSPDHYSLTALENKGVYQTPPAASPPEAAGRTSALAAGSPSSLARPMRARSMGSYTLADLEADVLRNDRGELMMEVTELFYSGSDVEVADVLEGQPIETLGRVIAERVNNPGGTRLRIFRLQVTCCVADARPCSIAVDFGKTAPAFKSMQWVKVRGIMHYEAHDGLVLPVLQAREMEPSAEPPGDNLF